MAAAWPGRQRQRVEYAVAELIGLQDRPDIDCITMFGNASAELYGLASAYNKHLGEHLTRLAQNGIHTAESTTLVSMLKLYDGLHAAETPFNVKEVSRWITAAVNLAVGYEEVLRMERRIIEDKAFLSINDENRINADGDVVPDRELLKLDLSDHAATYPSMTAVRTQLEMLVARERTTRLTPNTEEQNQVALDEEIRQWVTAAGEEAEALASDPAIVVEDIPFESFELVREPCDGIDLDSEDEFKLVDEIRRADMDDVESFISISDHDEQRQAEKMDEVINLDGWEAVGEDAGPKIANDFDDIETVISMDLTEADNANREVEPEVHSTGEPRRPEEQTRWTTDKRRRVAYVGKELFKGGAPDEQCWIGPAELQNHVKFVSARYGRPNLISRRMAYHLRGHAFTRGRRVPKFDPLDLGVKLDELLELLRYEVCQVSLRELLQVVRSNATGRYEVKVTRPTAAEFPSISWHLGLCKATMRMSISGSEQRPLGPKLCLWIPSMISASSTVAKGPGSIRILTWTGPSLPHAGKRCQGCSTTRLMSATWRTSFAMASSREDFRRSLAASTPSSTRSLRGATMP